MKKKKGETLSFIILEESTEIFSIQKKRFAN